MCLTSHWPIIFRIRESSLMPTISIGEIIEKMSKLTIISIYKQSYCTITRFIVSNVSFIFKTILTAGLLKLCKEERKCLVEGEGTSKKTNRRKPGLNTGTKKTTAANRMSRTPNRTRITRSQSGKRLNSMCG